jgi:uncharacterized integral membrane protein (TIGR00698 family)
MIDLSRAAVSASRRFRALAPGILLWLGLTALALIFEWLEARLFGRAWLEALVLAILCGAAVRTAWRPSPGLEPGIRFSAKPILEVAVVLLGASVSLDLIVRTGPWLVSGVGVLVLAAIAVSYAIGRAFALPHRLAVLIACGNSICGNSAIAAVAPVIGAEEQEVAASIAFTAVLGVAVVLVLPLVATAFHMGPRALGALAGLTVYAVPQVLPATAAAGAASVQTGVLVKLTRVLMLGPVLLAISLIGRGAATGAGVCAAPKIRFRPGELAPWFLIGFALMMLARSVGGIPQPWLAPMRSLATLLTIVSMAALGLGVDVRAIAQAGLRVTATVSLSLLTLGGLALMLIRLVGMA